MKKKFFLGFLGYIWLVGCQTTKESNSSYSKVKGENFQSPLPIDGRVYLTNKEFYDRLAKGEKYWATQHKGGERYAPELLSYKIALKKNKEAERLARYNLGLNYEDEESLYFLGVAEFQQGHVKAAEAIFLTLVTSNRPSIKSDACNSLGLLAWQEKNWEEASSYFDQAIKNSRYNSAALLNRSFLALAFNETTKAETLLSELISLEGPAFDDARFHYGVAQSLLGKKDSAIESYESVTDYKNSPLIMLNLAITYFNAGEDDEAASFLRKYINMSSAKTMDARRTAALSRGLHLRKGKEPLTDEEIRKLAGSLNESDKSEDDGLSIMTDGGTTVPLE